MGSVSLVLFLTVDVGTHLPQSSVCFHVIRWFAFNIFLFLLQVLPSCSFILKWFLFSVTRFSAGKEFDSFPPFPFPLFQRFCLFVFYLQPPPRFEGTEKTRKHLPLRLVIKVLTGHAFHFFFYFVQQGFYQSV